MTRERPQRIETYKIYDDFEPDIRTLSKQDREAKRERALGRIEQAKDQIKQLNVNVTPDNQKYGIIVDEHVWVMSQNPDDQPYRLDGTTPTRSEMDMALKARKLALDIDP